MPRKKTIKHYRGDTYDAILGIDNYTPGEDDVVLFGIKENLDDDDSEYLIRKTVDPTTMYLHLTSEETQDLPERCYYDAQVTYTDTDEVSYTKTFIYGPFIVTKDVVK